MEGSKRSLRAVRAAGGAFARSPVSQTAHQTADHYATLGVSPSASDLEIRAAFRRLARQYHPDVNPAPDAADRFRAVAAAYEVLSDPAQRARYDSARRAGGGTAGGAGG